MVLERGEKTITALAAEAGASRSYFTRILRLGFLAPDLVEMILRGRQPVELTARHLSLHRRLPIVWSDQLAALGVN